MYVIVENSCKSPKRINLFEIEIVREVRQQTIKATVKQQKIKEKFCIKTEARRPVETRSNTANR